MRVLTAVWPLSSGPEIPIRWVEAPGLVEWVRAHPSEGVYEVDRTYPGSRILLLEEHLDRLEASAAREGIPFRVDRSRFRAVLRRLVEQSGFESARFLVRVRAMAPDAIDFVLEEFRPPPAEAYEKGVVCATMVGARRAHPEAKTSSWMSDRQSFALPVGTYEGLLLSEQEEILEGATSNFYAILAGELRTAEKRVLPGISRRIVLQIAPDVLPVRLDPIRIADLPRVEEAFLTSSSRAILPIRELDGVVIGSGRPGPRTGELLRRYRAWVEEHLTLL